MCERGRDFEDGVGGGVGGYFRLADDGGGGGHEALPAQILHLAAGHGLRRVSPTRLRRDAA